MTDHFWKKVDFIFGLFPLAAIFGLLAVSASIEVKDLDLWLHLAMGKFITLHGYVPDVDVLSCSIQGAPWVNHEWLFQVVVYKIFHAWGPSGLINMQLVIVSVTMLLLLLLGFSRDRQLPTTIILFLVYMIYQQRFTFRPDLFSLLFFAAYIFVLSLHVDKRWSLPVLFVVQVLWVNMHGYFFFGPLFVLIGIVSEMIKRHVPLPYEWNESGRLTDDEYSRIKKMFFFIVLACLFNPLFVRGALYPINVFFSLSGENQIFFKHIQELQQPISWETIFSREHYVYYKLMIFLSFVSFVFNRRRIDVSALLFWIIFLVFSLKASRNTSFFAFAAYLVFITNFFNICYSDFIPIRFIERKFQYLTTIFISVLFVLWAIGYFQALSGRSYYDFSKYEMKSEFGGISLKNYPNEAVDFLVNNQVKGNFFNDFNSGAYLLGRTFPDIKVFIDGRTEVYGAEFFKEYREIWDYENAELFEAVLQRHQMTGVLLNSSRQRIPGKILEYLYGHQDWHLVYLNYDAVIFLKNTPGNKAVIDKYEIDLEQWEALRTNLFKLGALRVKPYQYYFRGYTLESFGQDDAALSELSEALRIDPIYPDAHEVIGKIYSKRKEYNKAFEHFRIAVMTLPKKKDARYNLALSYFDLGEYEGAVKQYRTITKMWPNEPKGYFLLAKSLIKDRRYAQAIESLKRAYALSPRAFRDLLELGDMMFEQSAYPEAQETYMMALQADKETASVHKKLGAVALAQGNREEARKEFEQALSLAPNDEEIQKSLQGLN